MQELGTVECRGDRREYLFIVADFTLPKGTDG